MGESRVGGLGVGLGGGEGNVTGGESGARWGWGVEMKAAVRLLLLVLFPHLIVLYRGSAKRSSSRVRPVMYNT